MPLSATGAMLFDSDAASVPDAAPTSGSEGWFSVGNVGTTKGTIVPGYWLDKVGGELSTLIKLLNPSPGMQIGNLVQLATFFEGLTFTTSTAVPTTTTSGDNWQLTVPVPGKIIQIMGGIIGIPSTGGGPFTYPFPFGGFATQCWGINGGVGSPISESASFGCSVINATEFEADTTFTSGGIGQFGFNWMAIGY
jgi:hypothetical protein